jgi:hypothetical protein
MEEMNEMPPVKIAFIIDNEVVDILHTDERLAAIFLSEPKVVDVTGQLLENDGIVKVSSKYDPETNTFYNEDEIN